MPVRCKKCGEILDCTPNRHVVVTCGCGASSVDAEAGYCRCWGEIEKTEEEDGN